MTKKKNKVKRKLRLKNFFLFCFVLFLLGIFGVIGYFLPIKNIIITGTTYLSDVEIIEAAGIKNYPPIFRTNSKEMKENIKELDFVEDVVISKSLWGQITFKVKEEIPLFFHRNKEKLILASGKEVDTNELYGLPILINYVPDEIYARMLKEMKEMDQSILNLISEIEYQPWKSDDVIIDDTRFYLRMNDGNVVYVNLINWDKLNNYMTIYATLGDEEGILQLDSSLGNGITFTPFE